MVYYYDNTFDGLMTAVFEIYAVRDNEAIIEPLSDIIPTTRMTYTVDRRRKSNRVRHAVWTRCPARFEPGFRARSVET